MSTSPLLVAKLAQQSLPKEGEEGFTMEQAVLFAYCADGLRVLGTAHDIYIGLANIADDETLHDYEDGIGIVTTGWAAPLNEDGEPEGMPSQHRDRRRVRLASCVSRDGKMGSALVFQDEPDETVTDEGDATGSLCEAMMEAIWTLVGKGR